MTQVLKTLGHKVTFVYSPFQEWDRDKALLARVG